MTEQPPTRVLANDQVVLTFDARTGALLSIRHAQGGELLRARHARHGPFALYHSLHSPYAELGPATSAHRAHTDPADLAQGLFCPGQGARAEFCATDSSLTIVYTDAHRQWRAELTVTLGCAAAASRWRLTLTNTGTAPAECLCVFPRLTGVRLGHGRRNRMVVANNAGYTSPLWAVRGGAYGDAAQQSMQWGCVFDDDPDGAHTALAFVVRDPELRPKAILYERPNIAVRYYPPRTLQPGESVTLPEVDLLVYTGDWKPAAQVYRAWFETAFPQRPLPAWVRDLTNWRGRWFWRRGQELPTEYAIAETVADHLTSFRELPSVCRGGPGTLYEYAFWGRGCMGRARCGRTQVHTDGDYVIREDLGGAEALREGIAGLHARGERFLFYVEAYICPKESDLVRHGQGLDWQVMGPDGSVAGPYDSEGKWVHMCPGAQGWQDHLAESAARLLRETGADGLRLDSLGFYAFPCYNPAHHHANPWDYNAWVMELLRKVSEAARAVNPEAYLMTEAGPDFFSRHFDGALTSPSGPGRIAVSRDVAPMRVAVPGYALAVYSAAGPVAASLMGYPGGCGGRNLDARFLELDRLWRSASAPVFSILRWGQAAHDNPTAGRPDVALRRFSEGDVDVIVGARPRYLDDYPRTPPPDDWLRNTNVALKRNRVSYDVRIETGARPPKRVELCDVLRGDTIQVPFRRAGDAIVVTVASNWFWLRFER